MERALAEIGRAFGGADILINNAGTGSNETIMEAPDDKWQYYWDLHVMAAVRLARGLVPGMRERGGGVIINNASICAKQPLGYEPIYNTTKAALMMFSKCLANEVIKDNIRVNCINPGLILTPDWMKTATQLTAGTGSTPEQYLDQIARKNAPIGRFATPEELAQFFVFLCSPRASYCVGSDVLRGRRLAECGGLTGPIRVSATSLTRRDSMSDAPLAYDVLLPAGSLSQYDNHIRRPLSAMRGQYLDAAAYDEMLSREDTLLYEVYEIKRPEIPGELSHGLSIVHRGQGGRRILHDQGPLPRRARHLRGVLLPGRAGGDGDGDPRGRLGGGRAVPGPRALCAPTLGAPLGQHRA